jgi:hypothetical protein
VELRYLTNYIVGFGHGHGHHHGHHHNHHHGFGFNRWGLNNNYMNMGGFVSVNYSQGWIPNIHDQMLVNNINQVFMRYDFNRSGQL